MRSRALGRATPLAALRAGGASRLPMFVTIIMLKITLIDQIIPLLSPNIILLKKHHLKKNPQVLLAYPPCGYGITIIQIILILNSVLVSFILNIKYLKKNPSLPEQPNSNNWPNTLYIFTNSIYFYKLYIFYKKINGQNLLN